VNAQPKSLSTAHAYIKRIAIPEPEFGEVAELRPGLLWIRLPLPMTVGHANAYLIEDGDGWAVVDCGYGDPTTLEIWENLFAGPLAGSKITKIIVTHAHFDHIGAAGWLCRRHEAPLHMSQVEYLTCRMDLTDPCRLEKDEYQSFLLSHGMDARQTLAAVKNTTNYPDALTGLPETYVPLSDGEMLSVGERQLEIMIGVGHSPAQVMIYCQAEQWFISADHVLAELPPLLIIPTNEPTSDPYGRFLESMERLADKIDPESLVLPGHLPPFTGFLPALRSLCKHYQERSEIVLLHCRAKACSIAEMAPPIFQRDLNPRQMQHAILEILCFANRLQREGKLRWLPADEERIVRMIATE